MLEILISILIGYLLGLVSGLIPGVHTNNIALILVAMSPIFMKYGFSPFCIATIIISNSITHTFLNIIPSVFLGAPESDTALAVLPGHSLVLEGKGIEAIRLSAIGSLSSVILSFALILPFMIVFSWYTHIQGYIGWLLLFIALIMILSERGIKFKGYATIVFFLSGILGMLAMNRTYLIMPFVDISPSILFPLFTGIFGGPMLIISLLTRTKIPEQTETGVSLPKKILMRGIFTGSLAGSIVSFLPGVSPAIGTLLARLFLPRGMESGKEYIVSISGVNTSNAIFCLLALYIIGKCRSGAMIAVNEVFDVSMWNEDTLKIFMASVLFVALLSYLSTILIGERASKILPRVNYALFSGAVLIFIVFMIVIFTGFFGLIVFLASMPIGLIPPFAGIKRTHAMGVLLLPLILQYLV
jgi:putative membrane protein